MEDDDYQEKLHGMIIGFLNAFEPLERTWKLEQLVMGALAKAIAGSSECETTEEIEEALSEHPEMLEVFRNSGIKDIIEQNREYWKKFRETSENLKKTAGWRDPISMHDLMDQIHPSAPDFSHLRNSQSIIQQLEAEVQRLTREVNEISESLKPDDAETVVEGFLRGINDVSQDDQ